MRFYCFEWCSFVHLGATLSEEFWNEIILYSNRNWNCHLRMVFLFEENNRNWILSGNKMYIPLKELFSITWSGHFDCIVSFAQAYTQQMSDRSHIHNMIRAFIGTFYFIDSIVVDCLDRSQYVETYERFRRPNWNFLIWF